MRVATAHTGSGARGEAVRCDVPGCSSSTREGKPYCSEHVDYNPYVSRLLDQIAERDKEDEAARSGKTLNVRGITAQSIIQHLAEHGPRTRERLCKELQIDMDVLDGYTRAMVRKKMVRRGRTRRGSVTLELRASA